MRPVGGKWAEMLTSEPKASTAVDHGGRFVGMEVGRKGRGKVDGGDVCPGQGECLIASRYFRRSTLTIPTGQCNTRQAQAVSNLGVQAVHISAVDC